jgi:hypothetical protein
MTGLLPQPREGGAGEIAALKAQIASLRQDMEFAKEAIITARDEAKTFYGLVDGGKNGMVLIYNELPTTENPEPKAPAAKARSGRWLKLAYPRFTFERVSESGPVTDTWYSMHVIDPVKGDISQKWVRDTVQDGSPSFSRFDVFPRDTPAPSS